MEDTVGALALASPAGTFRQRAATAPDRRLARLLSGMLDAMGDLIEAEEVSRADLREVVEFLTAVGEACSGQRQEWVLLLDALGLTTAVENRAARRPAGATPNTLAGPFYRPGAPLLRDGESISIDGRGEALMVKLRVTDLEGRAVADALVEIWQADGQGVYENQAPDRQPEFNLRGQFRTGPDGRVTMRSVRPAGYAVPGDGPVGALLRRLGFGLERPAHLHLRITAPGFERLTTHVFDRGDPAIGHDPLFAVHPALLADIIAAPGEGWSLSFNPVLARGGTEEAPPRAAPPR